MSEYNFGGPYTTGDGFRCNLCGAYVPFNTFHMCSARNTPIPSQRVWPSEPISQTGWCCPACGRGNAPWSAQCGCGGRTGTTTTTSNVTVTPTPARCQKEVSLLGYDYADDGICNVPLDADGNCPYHLVEESQEPEEVEPLDICVICDEVLEKGDSSNVRVEVVLLLGHEADLKPFKVNMHGPCYWGIRGWLPKWDSSTHE